MRTLFICAYAQSRSKYFAEELMYRLSARAMFCGYLDEADFPLTKNHLEWADRIVLLDKDIKRTTLYHDIVYLCNNSDKQLIEFYIEDEPSTFIEKFQELLDLKWK